MAQYYLIKSRPGRLKSYYVGGLFAVMAWCLLIEVNHLGLLCGAMLGLLILTIGFMRQIQQQQISCDYYLKVETFRAYFMVGDERFLINKNSCYLNNWIWLRMGQKSLLFAPDMLDKQAQSRLRRTIKILRVGH
ncbi:hypothetical protein [Gayadomonas joobiniege]|uniref:hypothetical protein n=1 Tax=Gayadomonas joobiniege TaxID=1234606 RepID=UPI0003813976|nr:hypothetical protein [Gayadomonas joobiniege]